MNAVPSLMMSGGWSGFIKFVFIIALFAYTGRHADMVIWFLQAFLFMSILNRRSRA